MNTQTLPTTSPLLELVFLLTGERVLLGDPASVFAMSLDLACDRCSESTLTAMVSLDDEFGDVAEVRICHTCLAAELNGGL